MGEYSHRALGNVYKWGPQSVDTLALAAVEEMGEVCGELIEDTDLDYPEDPGEFEDASREVARRILAQQVKLGEAAKMFLHDSYDDDPEVLREVGELEFVDRPYSAIGVREEARDLGTLCVQMEHAVDAEKREEREK